MKAPFYLASDDLSLSDIAPTCSIGGVESSFLRKFFEKLHSVLSLLPIAFRFVLFRLTHR